MSAEGRFQSAELWPTGSASARNRAPVTVPLIIRHRVYRPRQRRSVHVSRLSITPSLMTSIATPPTAIGKRRTRQKPRQRPPRAVRSIPLGVEHPVLSFVANPQVWPASASHIPSDSPDSQAGDRLWASPVHVYVSLEATIYLGVVSNSQPAANSQKVSSKVFNDIFAHPNRAPHLALLLPHTVAR